MNDRFVELEERIERLEEALRHMERRVSTLDPLASANEEEPVLPAVLESGRPAAVLPGFVALTGRSFLVLGGAFLVRAATEANAVSRGAGAVAGLLYAGIWLFLGDRDGRRDRPASAAFHGVTAAVIAFPLLWESCTRFGLLSPAAAVIAVAVTAAILFALSAHRAVEALAWAATLGALGTFLALLVSTREVGVCAGALILLAGAAIWLARGRGWSGPRWPAAVGADLAVAAVPAFVGKGLSFGTGIALALALPAVCVPALALPVVLRKRSIAAFEMLQISVSLLVGFGAAISVARESGTGVGIFGLAALGAGLGAYGVAFRLVEPRGGRTASFHFFASLALLLMIVGGAFWLSGSALAFLWSALALVVSILAVFGARFAPKTLRWHAAVYIASAAGASGFVAFVGGAFAGRLGGAALEKPTAPVLCVVAAAVGVSCVLAGTRREPDGRQRSLPGFFVGIAAFAGLGAAEIQILAAGTPGDGGRLAAVRTGTLTAIAIVAALLGRRVRTRELSWLVYPLLVLGGLKLLIEDVPNGRPATLFIGFVLYGAALLVAPRIARAGPIASPISP